MIIQQAEDSQLVSSGTVNSLMIVKSLINQSMDPQIRLLIHLILAVDSKIIKFVLVSMSNLLVVKMRVHVAIIVTTSLLRQVQHKMISAANMKMMVTQTQMVSVICSKVNVSKKLNTAILQNALSKRIVILLTEAIEIKNGVVMPGLLILIEITIETHSIKRQKHNLMQIWRDPRSNPSLKEENSWKSHTDGTKTLSFLSKKLVLLIQWYKNLSKKEQKLWQVVEISIGAKINRAIMKEEHVLLMPLSKSMQMETKWLKILMSNAVFMIYVKLGTTMETLKNGLLAHSYSVLLSLTDLVFITLNRT